MRCGSRCLRSVACHFRSDSRGRDLRTRWRCSARRCACQVACIAICVRRRRRVQLDPTSLTVACLDQHIDHATLDASGRKLWRDVCRSSLRRRDRCRRFRRSFRRRRGCLRLWGHCERWCRCWCSRWRKHRGRHWRLQWQRCCRMCRRRCPYTRRCNGRMHLRKQGSGRPSWGGGRAGLLSSTRRLDRVAAHPA